MPKFYPISIDIENVNCLVIGGGKVAERKVATLLSYGAKVTLICPDITVKLNVMAKKGEIRHLNKCYEKGDCKGMRIIIIATDSEPINREIAQEANSLNCLVNVVDQPDISNFIVPATLRQGDLHISISTNGQSPALARRIREKLEKEFGMEYAKFLELAGEVRRKAIAMIPDPEKRREFFFNLVDSDIIQLIQEGKDQEIKKRLEDLLERYLS